MCYLVPGLAIDCVDDAVARSYAGGVEFGTRRFGLSGIGWQVTPTDKQTRLLGKCHSAFLFVQCGCSLCRNARTSTVAGRPQYRRQDKARVAVVDQRIGAFGDGDGLLGHLPGGIVGATSRK